MKVSKEINIRSVLIEKRDNLIPITEPFFWNTVGFSGYKHPNREKFNYKEKLFFRDEFNRLNKKLFVECLKKIFKNTQFQIYPFNNSICDVIRIFKTKDDWFFIEKCVLKNNRLQYSHFKLKGITNLNNHLESLCTSNFFL